MLSIQYTAQYPLLSYYVLAKLEKIFSLYMYRQSFPFSHV
uniref:Uncharacterized protein n=1 Tax=Arundo donax TaxID=35708 RepID=A0A0A9BNB5_ARUDO